MDEYDQVIQTLPSWLARPLLELPSTLAPQVQEVRLRVGCTPMFTVRGAVYAPQELGREGKALQTLRLTPPQMEEILFTLCGGSVHTHQTEIAQGYVTLASGCRARSGRSGFYERKQSARIWGALPCALRLVCRGQHLRADIRASAGASKNHRIT